MKPSKINVDQGAQKKIVNQNPSKIKSYFKAAPKQFTVENKKNYAIEPSDSSRVIYIHALEKKLKELDGEDSSNQIKPSEEQGATGYDANANKDSTSTVNIQSESVGSECARIECIKKADEYMELDAKHKALKKVYFTATSHYTELSIKYKALLKSKSHIDQTNVGEASLTDDFFTKNELKFLECMPLDKKKDSTFILQCLEFAYKDGLSTLRDKTLKGKAESIKISNEGTVSNVPAKGALTPIKVVRIKELFLQRISKCDIDSNAYIERVSDSNIHKLIASGIKNIAKKQI